MKLSSAYAINRSETVSLSTVTSIGKNNFQDIDNLRGKKIKVIDTFPVSAVSKDSNGNALVNANAYKCGFLVLSVKGKEAVNRIPLSALDPTQNNGRRMSFNDIIIDFLKSYVEFGDSSTTVTGEVVLFNFYFDDEE